MKFVPSIGADYSGSLGGITASRNRYGQYFRRKASPVNPNSTRQQTVRAAFATAIVGWTSLSAANKALWNDYAANTPFVDGLGNQKFVTGQNMYCRSATLRTLIGEAAVAAGPGTFNFGNPVTSYNPTVDGAPANTLAFETADLSTTANIVGGASGEGDVAIFIGRPINTNRAFYKGPYQLAGVAPIAAAADNVNFDAAPTIGGTALGVGQTRSTRFVVIYDDGRVSPSFETISVVHEDTP
jgi:hypothetical protein